MNKIELTRDHLRLLFPDTSDQLFNFYAADLLIILKRYAINNRLRIAAFIAQIRYESGNLVYAEEIADGSAYDNRRDLGNTEYDALTLAKSNDTTPGRMWKGRGLIQLTGYYNYQQYAKYLKVHVVENPDIVKGLPYSVDVAGWFWVNRSRHGLNCNQLADVDRFTDITRVINGGTNGLKKRLEYYRQCLSVIDQIFVNNEIEQHKIEAGDTVNKKLDKTIQAIESQPDNKQAIKQLLMDIKTQLDQAIEKGMFDVKIFSESLALKRQMLIDAVEKSQSKNNGGQ